MKHSQPTTKRIGMIGVHWAEAFLKILELATFNKETHIILCGGFNCPNIDWQSLTLTTDFNFTQVQTQPTRENNILDLVFTLNPSLIKSTSTTPGISDYDIVVVDSDTKPYYTKQKPRKSYSFSKANWENLKNDLIKLT
ncbi:hypothetical protein MAR_004255 [Mya arenaria]|uniref:Endonuclease/exonuclease/phosphatase domain-containing protein n=1 Tax=Mya arenaria TaxID=6604 RepID=A0ABY7EW20_MYAAR|nr:hypothetical protein MAR_004255 [Mya arenaria]